MAKATKSVAAKISKTTTKSKASAIAPKSNGFTNPFRENGGYWSSIEALRTLGIGKMHDFDSVLSAYRKAMGTEAWKAFAAKGGKLTADQRAMVNVMVTARKDYGAPVIEQGYHVVWDGRAKTVGLFKVGTAPTTAAPKVAEKPQTVVKATGAKPKGKTRPKAAKPQAKAGKAAKAK